MIVIWFSNFIACTVVPKLHHNNQIPFEMTENIGIGTIFMVCIDSDKLELVLFCCRLHEYSRHSIQVCTVSGQSAYQRNQQWTNSNYYFPNVSQMSNLYASRLSLFSQCWLLDVLSSIIIYMTNKRKPSWIESCNCWQSFRVCNFRLQWFHDREHVFYMWSDLIASYWVGKLELFWKQAMYNVQYKRSFLDLIENSIKCSSFPKICIFQRICNF